MKKKINYTKLSNQSLKNYFVFLKRYRIVKKKKNFYKILNQWKYLRYLYMSNCVKYFNLFQISDNLRGLYRDSNLKQRHERLISYNNEILRVTNITTNEIDFSHLFFILNIRSLLTFYTILISLFLIKIYFCF